MHFGTFVQVFHDAPRDGNAVVSRSAASQFVEKHQATLRDVVHDVRRLTHFDHKGTLAHRNIVRCAHTREDLVDDPHPGRVGRDERTDLRHQGNKRRLSKQCTLTRHVRSCDHHDLLFRRVQSHIIGHIFLTWRHERLDHRVSSRLDVQHLAFVHHRADIVLCHCQYGQRVIHVQLRERMRIALQRCDMFGRRRHQFAVKSSFEHQNFIFCPEDFLLIFLQLLRDVALRIDERLFAYPFRRHKLLISIAHLHIITEHVVETDFQTLDAGTCDFAFLDLEQIVLSRGLNVAQFVELCIHPVCDDLSLVHRERRVGAQFAFDALPQRCAGVQAFADVANALLGSLLARIFEHHHRFQSTAQLLHLSRIDASRRHLRDDAFQVAHLPQFHFAEFSKFRFAEEMLHTVQSLFDLLHRAKREKHLPSHQSRAHR